MSVMFRFGPYLNNNMVYYTAVYTALHSVMEVSAAEEIERRSRACVFWPIVYAIYIYIYIYIGTYARIHGPEAGREPQ